VETQGRRLRLLEERLAPLAYQLVNRRHVILIFARSS
jgi:hypothetical protein